MTLRLVNWRNTGQNPRSSLRFTIGKPHIYFDETTRSWRYLKYLISWYTPKSQAEADELTSIQQRRNHRAAMFVLKLNYLQPKWNKGPNP